MRHYIGTPKGLLGGILGAWTIAHIGVGNHEVRIWKMILGGIRNIQNNIMSLQAGQSSELRVFRLKIYALSFEVGRQQAYSDKSCGACGFREAASATSCV